MTRRDQYSPFGMPGAALAIYVDINAGVPKIDVEFLSTPEGGAIITVLVIFAFLAIVSVVLSELAAPTSLEQKNEF